MSCAYQQFWNSKLVCSLHLVCGGIIDPPTQGDTSLTEKTVNKNGVKMVNKTVLQMKIGSRTNSARLHLQSTWSRFSMHIAALRKC